MSYESKMLEQFSMPSRKSVENALLRSLLKHGGVIKEFGTGQEVVDEIASEFGLNERQRSAFLQTVYRKENRIKKSLLWHRLLFRAADSLANDKLVTRPTKTLRLTKRKEWMLTEKGFDKALKLTNISTAKKYLLQTKSYEVQKIVNKLSDFPAPKNYNPIDHKKKVAKVTKESAIRWRGFRQAVIEVYNFQCSICGMTINSPDSLTWEVNAAHIVPHSSLGRDDICNGLALCRLHHWAFDVGWFTLHNNYKVLVSKRIHSLPTEFGRFGDYEFIRVLLGRSDRIILPNRSEQFPHHNAIKWHRENIFYQ